MRVARSRVEGRRLEVAEQLGLELDVGFAEDD